MAECAIGHASKWRRVLMSKNDLIDALTDFFEANNTDIDLEDYTFEELEWEFKRQIGELY